MDDTFPVVVAIGLAIFGIFWIGSQASIGGFALDGNQTESMLLYSTEPGTIGSSNEDFRTIKFGSFTVGETRGDVQAYTAERATLSNSLFGGNSIVVNYNATQPGSGNITFEVLGRQSKGKIYVKVNGNEVFKAATVSGATPEIKIPKTSFKTGINQIRIGTTQPNLLKTAVYTIEDVEITVEDRKFHDYTDYFQIYQHEIESYRASNLTFQIPVDASVPNEPLTINVNNEQVYSQRVGRSTQEVRITPQNADLSTGYNTIEFSTDGNSKYRIENANLQLRYSVKVQPATRNLNFKLSKERLKYAKRRGTKEVLSFQYQKNTVSEPIKIKLNDAYYTVSPQNGGNLVEIEESVLKSENSVEIRSNQTFMMKNLEITSKQEK